MLIVPFLLGTVVIPAVVIIFTTAGERLLVRFSPTTQRRIRPWFWLAPIIIVVGVILLYPIVSSVMLAFAGPDGTGNVGFDNFAWAFGESMRPLLLNNIIWLVLLPAALVVLGIVLAVLIDRVRYEAVARVILVLPTAISFVAASVTWRALYAYAPEGRTQLGLFNALRQLVGLEPVPWIARPPSDAQWLNTVALVVVAAWAGLGIALLVLSAAVKAVPTELLEAARLDGANEFRAFWNVTLPAIWPSVLTVLTTQIIAAIKIFDVVYVMTNGNNGTNVVANQMYGELFNRPEQLGHAAAIAIVLLVVATPIIWFNIRSVRQQGTL
ncbi:MAG TPA: sugar ABC transporter permease [Plantibacter sp.]|uniref:carbohydrate ABC transporter permease n=1 Tax=Plantibacter sp. TaxID=1871045 RepID=UPI002CC19F9D|nr:sugar ABC transporter permease [Plantibacter sp.]